MRVYRARECATAKQRPVASRRMARVYIAFKCSYLRYTYLIRYIAVKTAPLLQRGLKLSHLRLLAVLAETGQVGAAAERLGISQPAASRLVAELERIAGQPVHRRTGRGIALTEQGAALANRAARIMLELEDAGREVSQIGAGVTGHVRIGSVTGPALDQVLPAVRAARLATPNVTFEVEVAPSDVLAGLIQSGQIDFSLARMPAGADPGLVRFQPFAAEPVALVVRHGHALMGRETIAPSDLMEYDWVMPGTGGILRHAVERRLRELALPVPQVRLATPSFLLTLALIQQSNAIAPLALAVVRQFADSERSPVGTLPIDLGIEMEPIGLITRAGGQLPPAAEQMRRLILRQAGVRV